MEERLPQGVEVVESEQPVLKKGTVEMFTKNAFKNPAPLWFIITMNTIIELNNGAIMFTAALNGISDRLRSLMIISLGVASYVCKALKKSIGVVEK